MEIGFMNNKKVTSIFRFSIVLVMNFFIILSLFFDLFNLKSGTEQYHENGFTFFTFNSLLSQSSYDGLKALSIIVSVLMYIILIFCIFSLLFVSVKRIFNGFDNQNDKDCSVIVVCDYAITIVYFVFGVIITQSLTKDTTLITGDMKVQTLSFIPFIICLIFLAVYYSCPIISNNVCKNKKIVSKINNVLQARNDNQQNIPNSQDKIVANPVPQVETTSQTTELEKIELLNKYNQLYQDGVLSKEEFAMIKSNLLKF